MVLVRANIATHCTSLVGYEAEVSALSGSITSVWHTSFGLFACPDFGPLQFVCFFFSPFLGCFLFMKFGRVSWLGYAPAHTPNYIPRTWVYISD
jgi:hypothetical protein